MSTHVVRLGRNNGLTTHRSSQSNQGCLFSLSDAYGIINGVTSRVLFRMRSIHQNIQCFSLVLPLFYFVLFRFYLFVFTEAAALRSVVLRSSICMRPDSQTQLPNNCLRPFSFLLLWRCRFFRADLCCRFLFASWRVCMESTSYVFPFRMVFFYLVTTGWNFYSRIQSITPAINPAINQSINQAIKQSIKQSCPLVFRDDIDRWQYCCLKKNQNAPRPSEHPPVMGEKCQNV